MAAAPSHFTSYVKENLLPITQIEVRESANRDAILALASHAPSCGISYAPVDDLIISIVVESQHSPVVRDVGSGRRTFVESPGCILVTPPRTASYWHFESTPLVLHITVPTERAEHLLDVHVGTQADTLTRLAERPLYDSLISQLASRMWSSLADTAPHTNTFITNALNTLLAILCHERTGAPAGGSSRRGWLVSRHFKHVTTLMANRLHDPPSVHEMASSVGLSPDHFLRSFAAVTGRTPHQWLTEMRIEKAKRLLRETQMPTTEIALELGFSSPGHFSSRFRQVVGMAPTVWRHTFANQPQETGDQPGLPA
ncbi:MAG: AraC family transcriptional regulator [Gammaproteobacteria bacterium]|nr:AraC family transcriptional regulator [Gammaproteobacteria bacterium]